MTPLQLALRILLTLALAITVPVAIDWLSESWLLVRDCAGPVWLDDDDDLPPRGGTHAPA